MALDENRGIVFPRLQVEFRNSNGRPTMSGAFHYWVPSDHCPVCGGRIDGMPDSDQSAIEIDGMRSPLI